MVEVEKEMVLVTPDSFKPSSKLFSIFGVFNPAAIRLKNGDILLYVRVGEILKKWQDASYYYSPRCISETKFRIIVDKFSKDKVMDLNPPYGFYFNNGTVRLTYISHFRRVLLDKTGMKIKKIEQKPSFYGVKEDPRIVYFEKEKNYYMTYVSLSRLGNISTSFAVSKDAYHWHRRGVTFRHQNKDVVLFPEKINGRYVALHRPEGNFEFTLPHVWISFSKDLEYWGDDKVLHITKEDSWDSGKIGAGAPPIKTKHGWLEIYHGVQRTQTKDKFSLKDIFKKHGRTHYSKKYSAGALLFDLKDPKNIITKSESNTPFLSPRHKYEKEGFVPNVIFPTGAIYDTSKEYLLVYSGAADKVTTVKKIALSEIFEHLKV